MYDLRSDDTLTLLMLGGFIAIAIAFGFMQRLLFLQSKNFFHVNPNDVGRALLSATELRLQLVLVVQTALQLAIFTYIYATSETAIPSMFESRHSLTLVLLLIFLGYFALKALLYTFVNGVFFDAKKNKEWMHGLLFITAMEGVVLYPVSLLSIYLGLDIGTMTVLMIIIIVVLKLLTAYKLFAIFFQTFDSYVQFFLYLCALETTPLLILWFGMSSAESFLHITH